MIKWRCRASHLGRFTLWHKGRRATQIGRFSLWHNGHNSRRATVLGRFSLWYSGRRTTELCRFTLWHNGRRATELGKFTLWLNGRRAKQPGLMQAPGVAHIFQRQWRTMLNPKENFTERVLLTDCSRPSAIFWRMNAFALEDSRSMQSFEGWTLSLWKIVDLADR